MGRVHKKKIAEYEAAENESVKSGEKIALAVEESNNSESEGEGKNEPKGRAKKPASKSIETDEDDEDDDDDFRSLQGDGDKEGDEGSAKKAIKRKAASVVDEEDDSEPPEADSDDEPLNGGGNASAAKKGRKGVSGAKGKGAAAKNGKAGRGKAKKAAEKEVAKNEDEEEYEVKDIVGHKVERGVSYFLIRWKGYTKADDTWEPEDTLSCPDIIDRYKKKQANGGKNSKKAATAALKKSKGKLSTSPADPNKEWEVDKIIDYAQEKGGRVFRIRWKGFGPKHDTWEPEENLSCDEIISKFMKRMKAQENVTFKELREEPKKTKRLVNETSPRTSYHSPIGRKSRRSVARKRVYYGDSDE